MAKDHTWWIEIESDRFDHTSELPPESNAGNRFYGKDLAEYLCNGFRPFGIEADFMDEDWGWLIEGRTEDGSHVEMGVYDCGAPDEPPSTASRLWRLSLRMLTQQKWLMFFKHWVETPAEPAVLDSLRKILSRDGIRIRSFEQEAG